MASEAARILADAIERDADAQEQGNLEDVDAHIEAVRREVLPINDIPRPMFKLALRFWKEWARASRNGWSYEGPIQKGDWPVMARTIAQHVRLGYLPSDKLIKDNFIRRRHVLPWRALKTLFGDSG